MKTKITESPSIAARFIHRGEVVAFPTETVYGLGANIFNEEAVEKIFIAKERPADNPLIAHIFDLFQLEQITSGIPETAAKLIEAFFPGPLTLILPKNERVPSVATAGLKTIGVRMPKDPIARQFLRACAVPVAAPSANLSGRPSPTTWRAVRADLGGRISCIIKGDRTKIGLESTVVDCSGDAPVILRAGAVTLEELSEVIPQTKVSTDADLTAPKSPGMKHRHYAPKAKVIPSPFPQYTVTTNSSAYIGLKAPPNAARFERILICEDVEEYARELFNFFRECDEMDVETVFCQTVDEEGLGLALMDRIRRAAYG
ncbi:MAG TPA: L-threonylcarbamoyladenylate synthase [Blastocatellia bacterium]|nr:L-threonylcarbamoyladenylate synthase [Blastocatellia bacterium]